MQCITKRPDDINPTETHRTLNKLFLVNANNHTVYCIIYEFEYFIVSFPGIFQKKLLIHPHYIGYIVEVILCRFEGCAFIRSCHLYHSSNPNITGSNCFLRLTRPGASSVPSGRRVYGRSLSRSAFGPASTRRLAPRTTSVTISTATPSPRNSHRSCNPFVISPNRSPSSCRFATSTCATPNLISPSS